MLHFALSSQEWLTILFHALAAGFIGPAFAMLFTVPTRFLPLIGLGSAITRGMRDLLEAMNVEIVIATFIACCICSLLFIYFGPKLRVPRPIFTVPCIISLIPGVHAYHALIALMQVIDNSDVTQSTVYIHELFHRGMLSIGIISAIAVGIAIPPLFFYQYRHTKL